MHHLFVCHEPVKRGKGLDIVLLVDEHADGYPADQKVDPVLVEHEVVVAHLLHQDLS